MPIGRSWTRLSFCFATALVAAALADPTIEAASNAHLFGPGNYTDHSNLDVLPMLSIGIFIAFLWIVVRVRQALGIPAGKRGDWVRNSAGALDGQTVLRLLPLVVLTQLFAVFSMETCEQLVVYGHMLGGWLWLGGPVAISLAWHALVGGVLALGLRRVLQTCASALDDFIRLLVTAAKRRPAARYARHERPLEFALCAPLLCRIGERAPPLSARSVSFFLT